MGRFDQSKKRGSRGKPPKPYDSWLEYDLHQGPLKGCSHHPDRLPYTIEKEYEPDFIVDNTLIEVKGRFRDRTEAAKYLWIRRTLWEYGEYELVFIFDNPNLPMPHAKKRANGTKQTHGEWSTKNGFTYYSKEDIPKCWSK